jgi:hypothetical protein
VRTSQERAQLERMRRTTGGTLLAPFSSSGALAAPLPAPAETSTPPRPAPEAPRAIDPVQAEVAVAHLAREAVIDARDPALVAAQASALALRAASRQGADELATARSDRPPPPVIPSIGRRRAKRRSTEPAS